MRPYMRHVIECLKLRRWGRLLGGPTEKLSEYRNRHRNSNVKSLLVGPSRESSPGGSPAKFGRSSPTCGERLLVGPTLRMFENVLVDLWIFMFD